jgi:hypothetical protein
VSKLRRFQDETDRLTVRAQSPDARVSVVVSGAGEIEVQLHSGAMLGTTESALAATINRTIGDALWSLRTEFRLIRRQILGTE